MLQNSTVTTPAKSTLLATLANVKTELGIASADTSKDAKLTRLLRVASMVIAQELGREPWLQTYSDRIPGDGGIYLWLPHWPCKGSPASITLGTGTSPTTVDATTYSVAGPYRRRLYRATGWTLSEAVERTPTAGSLPLDYTIALAAGWVMPDQIGTWTAATAYAAGSWVQPTSTKIQDPMILFESGGGTSHATAEPSWNFAEGTTTTDGTITWTARRQRLPHDLEEAAMVAVMAWHRGGLHIPAGVRGESADGWRIDYRDRPEAYALPAGSLALVERWR